MTLDEAKTICETLTQINLEIWKSCGDQKKELVEKFRSTYMSVANAGFRIKRCKLDDGVDRRPLYIPRIDRHRDDVVIGTNKPDSFKVKGDCTTRCLSFCTGIDYMLIRNEQLSLAHQLDKSWKDARVWGRCLTSRGYVRVWLRWKHMSRATFLKLARSLPINEGIIATVSSNHVAAIDMKSRKILDSYNSSGGRITSMFVPQHQADTYMRWLHSKGFSTSI